MAAVGGFPGRDNSHELNVYLRAAERHLPPGTRCAAPAGPRRVCGTVLDTAGNCPLARNHVD